MLCYIISIPNSRLIKAWTPPTPNSITSSPICSRITQYSTSSPRSLDSIPMYSPPLSPSPPPPPSAPPQPPPKTRPLKQPTAGTPTTWWNRVANESLTAWRIWFGNVDLITWRVWGLRARSCPTSRTTCPIGQRWSDNARWRSVSSSPRSSASPPPPLLTLLSDFALADPRPTHALQTYEF